MIKLSKKYMEKRKELLKKAILNSINRRILKETEQLLLSVKLRG